ncbi:transcriptional regulator [Nocardia gipuzkoensis]|uniref:TenA family protein n=1 Tax=Nocardia gipuzkoensis TaxID=2749991 RepID=UPI001E2E6F5B|nr:transcriptional regulator [Nocardia gipuzkoensis]UGT69348.1 transcriptional regulator [Nocardia gipuzkoensis]
MSLAAHLEKIGLPSVEAQLAHPTVVGIAEGTLPEPVFRSWLEQDYLFLLDYVRVFARLAWQAPAAHLGDLVDLAHATYHEELALHRSLAAEFGADLDGAAKGAPCAAYTAFLLDSAASYGEGLAALYPCMWGYSTLGARLAQRPPAEPRYRRWVDTYADPGFAALTRRCAQMIDESGADPARAEDLFREGLRHELAFWDVPLNPSGTEGHPAPSAE